MKAGNCEIHKFRPENGTSSPCEHFGFPVLDPMAASPEIARANGRKGGRPKGSVSQKTVEKELQREIARQIIAARLRPIIEAQCDNAEGIKHFLKRDPKTGKFERLTDPEQIAAAMNEDGAEEGSSYWIYSKDPNPQSGKDMLDRLLDRAKEQEQEVNANVSLTIAWQD